MKKLLAFIVVAFVIFKLSQPLKEEDDEEVDEYDLEHETTQLASKKQEETQQLLEETDDLDAEEFTGAVDIASMSVDETSLSSCLVDPIDGMCKPGFVLEGKCCMLPQERKVMHNKSLLCWLKML